MVSTFTSYQLISKDLNKSLARTAANAQVARETKYYLDNITKIKSIDDFIKNTRLYNYAMKAFGLEDMAYAKAFMRKVLTGGIESPSSFANRLQDERYVAFARTFNFAKYGAATTSFAEARQGTVDKYVRQTLEVTAGEENQGVRLALYFQRKAPTIRNIYQILADPALAQVVRTVLSLPESSAMANVDAQAAMIEKRLDVTSFRNEASLKRFLQRFTTMWDIANTGGAGSSPALTIMTTGSSRYGLGVEALMNLQSIRSRG